MSGKLVKNWAALVCTQKVHLRFCLAEILCKHVRLKIGGKIWCLLVWIVRSLYQTASAKFKESWTHMEIFLDFCLYPRRSIIYESTDLNWSIEIKSLIQILGYGHQTPEVAKEYDFMMYYMILPLALRAAIGHQFSDLVKGCTFRGIDCLNSRYNSSILRISLN